MYNSYCQQQHLAIRSVYTGVANSVESVLTCTCIFVPCTHVQCKCTYNRPVFQLMPTNLHPSLQTDFANRDARAAFFTRIEGGPDPGGPPRGFPGGPGMYNPGMGPRGAGMMMSRPGIPVMGMGRGGFPPHGHGPPMDYYYPYMDEGMGYYGGGRPPFHGPGPMGMRRFSHGRGPGPFEEGFDEYEEELRAFTRKREWERERDKRKDRKKRHASSSDSEDSDSDDSSSKKKKKAREKEKHKKASKKEKPKEKSDKSEGETDSEEEEEEKREEARLKATQKSRDLREKLKKKSRKKKEKGSDGEVSSGAESGAEDG